MNDPLTRARLTTDRALTQPVRDDGTQRINGLDQIVSFAGTRQSCAAFLKLPDT